ncbi:DUF1236 domain-containing protein [Pseudophaeobacter flagellatus]|uniref:DUF1236 domain-containing protein n=1 Tax=Pseudophaeobacter flagellatus TaxID=2899119 RepID=UPI001E2A2089|nr:DUF1236 domain-containing protein [Pseudophaeobacter flagellatus]MCD9150085.1 DUF1236 domain-containing protein [Pseudophaeobacter flagellatus]
MNVRTLGMVSAIAMSIAAPALAQTAKAVAATDLNIRSGPSPFFDVIGVIPGGTEVAIDGCLDTASWCKVAFDDLAGWSYSDYLAVGVEDVAVALSTRPDTVTVNTVTYEDTVQTQSDQNTGAAAGATIGALAAYALGGPIGGIIVGGILGAGAGVAVVEPSETTVTYISQNPVETVYLEGEVVVGAGLPEVVTTYKLPQPELRYVAVNGQTVVIDAETNKIVRVIR